MNKIDVLKTINFGESVAEDDAKLDAYFVETDSWKRLIEDEVDIVYGPKGSGKSALYKNLLSNESYLNDKNIVLVAAENITGAAVFQSILGTEELNESTYKHLWYMYILALIGKYIKENDYQTQECKIFISKLQEEGLAEGRNIRRLLSDVKDYVINIFKRIEAIETGLGFEGFSGRISLSEPTYEQKKLGIISVYDLLDIANDALMSINKKTWVIFDRLDVSFSEKPEVERVAIRTLFQVYNDLKSYDFIKLKIFIRDDIWQRIIDGGFREASHITKSITIKWNEENLRNLIVQRIIDNEIFTELWDIDKPEVIRSADKQEEVFYKVFPYQVDSGERKPNTFNWMLSRVKDGLSVVAPRELIQLINEAKIKQIEELETGDITEKQLEKFIGRKALKKGLEAVSKKRLEQTIYAEYFSLKKYIKKLEGQKAEQSLENLAHLFELDLENAKVIVENLCEIGIFEKKADSYWVPFMYRPALNLIQGREDSIQQIN
ncbi:hypothetical protein AAGS61_08745 [Lysinibacillus sp. KU-BSD001]|uniref:P-loop ATPase, Sll1717 family n=1 Tax=Lysinibacillus sp. KU-BSD001 TaxID=3141328 RepID=UPI0036EE6B11